MIGNVLILTGQIITRKKVVTNFTIKTECLLGLPVAKTAFVPKPETATIALSVDTCESSQVVFENILKKSIKIRKHFFLINNSRGTLWTSGEWGECKNNCSGNGICNSNGNCHCDDKYGGPACDEKGYGGSSDSNRANYKGEIF